MPKKIITLGIETSCDETAAAILEGEHTLRSNVIASQDDIHHLYGGVVPELACRRHIEMIRPVVHEALEKGAVTFDDIDLVAVTTRPGLIGALLVGLSYAKGLCYGRNLPLVGVNHLDGHIAAALLQEPETPLPAVGLLVSGGHTELFWVEGIGVMTWLGGTRDDAAGEAFDKVARMLGLGYPGGPRVQREAEKGEARFTIPIGLFRSDKLEFSFSGPKTAVKQLIRKEEESGAPLPVADICASFQASVVEALYRRTRAAATSRNALSILLGGGVACNGPLRKKMRALGEELSIPVVIPSPLLCADNGAMIACAGAAAYLNDPDNARWRDYASLDASNRTLQRGK